MTGDLIKRRNTDTETCTQGEYHVNTKREMGVKLLQAKEQQRLPGNHQNLRGEAGNRFPSKPSEGTNLLTNLI